VLHLGPAPYREPALRDAVAGVLAAGVAPASAPAPPPSAATAPLAIGAVVRVVDGALNLRAAPGLAAPVVRVLPDGTLLTVLAGPTEADNLAWYEVDAGADGTGWSAGDFLQPI
jgi:uncharacterized protein YraI